MKMYNITPRYVRSHSMKISLNSGFLPKVPMCAGPTPSTSRGMDQVCCANCEILRVFYYDYNGFFIEDKIAIEYVMSLIRTNPKLLTGLSITTCSDTTIHYIPTKSYVERELMKVALKEQCNNMHKARLVNNGITKETVKNYLVCDSNGIPYIMPALLQHRSKFGGDDGVEIVNDILKVVDESAMVKSGKWVHLVLYYDVLDYLMNKPNIKYIF